MNYRSQAFDLLCEAQVDIAGVTTARRKIDSTKYYPGTQCLTNMVMDQMTWGATRKKIRFETAGIHQTVFRLW